MQRTTPLKIVTTALFASLMAAPASAGGDYPPCGTFVLVGGDYKIEGLDLGPKGDGMSDERITKQKLFDADGNFAGVARLVHIVVEPEEDSHEDIITLGINAFSLPKGTLYGQVMMDYKSDFWDDELPKDTARIAIVGGTGAYLRSKGQIVVTFDMKRLTPTRAEFQLYCE